MRLPAGIPLSLAIPPGFKFDADTSGNLIAIGKNSLLLNVRFLALRADPSYKQRQRSSSIRMPAFQAAGAKSSWPLASKEYYPGARQFVIAICTALTRMSLQIISRNF